MKHGLRLVRRNSHFRGGFRVFYARVSTRPWALACLRPNLRTIYLAGIPVGVIGLPAIGWRAIAPYVTPALGLGGLVAAQAQNTDPTDETSNVNQKRRLEQEVQRLTDELEERQNKLDSVRKASREQTRGGGLTYQWDKTDDLIEQVARELADRLAELAKIGQ